MSLFQTITSKNYSKTTLVKNVYRDQQKLRNKSEEKIIKAVKDRIIRDIKNLFEQKEQDYYKPVRVGIFYSNNYIEFESNDDTNKTLSIREYRNEIKPYLKDT